MSLCKQSCLPGHLLSVCLSVLLGKNFHAGHYAQTFHDLDLGWGHKISTKQNLLAPFSCTLVNWMEWNFVWWWSNLSWTSWEFVWVSYVESRQVTAVLQTALKNLNAGLHLGIYELIWSNLVWWFFFFFFWRSPAISLGFTTFGWDFCVCDRFLIQPLR